MPAVNTLKRFFAPVNFGKLQPRASGTRLARPETTTSAPVEDVPLPSESPDEWDLAIIGGKSYPPPDAQGLPTGVAAIKFSPKAKLDKQSGAGAPKPKVKKTGAEATKLSISFRFNELGLPAMMALAKTLQVGTGPHTIGGPKAKSVGVDRFEVESWDDAPGPGGDGWFVWAIQCVEVKASAQNGTGGGAAGTLAELEAAIAATLAELDAVDDRIELNPPNELESLRNKRAELKDRSLALIAKRDALRKTSGGSAVSTPKVAANTASGTLSSVKAVETKKTAAQGASKP